MDNTGNAYVTGVTDAASFDDFPTGALDPAGPFQPERVQGSSTDAFVTKINPAGTKLVYSTFLGGRAFDRGNGIAVDNTGNAYVTGVTDAASFDDFPTGALDPAGPFQPERVQGSSTDAFVTKINPAGTKLVYSTFLGGREFARGNGIAVDNAGNAYVTGFTDFASIDDFPTAAQDPAGPVQPKRVQSSVIDVFVAKISEGNDDREVEAEEEEGVGGCFIGAVLFRIGYGK